MIKILDIKTYDRQLINKLILEHLEKENFFHLFLINVQFY